MLMYVKDFLKLLRFNLKTLIIFSFTYTISGWVIMAFIQDFMYYGAIRFSGLAYIGQNNLVDFLLSPFTWVYYIVKAAVILFAILYELTAMVIIYDCSHNRIKISFFQLIKSSFSQVRKLCRVKNAFLIIDLLLFVPFVGLSGITNMSSDIRIPGFIMDYIEHHEILALLLLIVSVMLYIYLIYRIFSFHAMIIRNTYYTDAAAVSKGLLKGRFIKTIVTLAVSGVLISLAAVLVLSLLSLGVSGVCTLLGFTFEKSEYYVLLIFFILYIYFYPFILIAKISTLYYIRDTEAVGHERNFLSAPASKGLKIGTISVVVICVGMFIASFVVDGISSAVILTKPVVGAHRGSSVSAPENTMPAFKLAIEEGVSDWIELDVHQTLDGVVIVSHDDNIKRVSGIDVCVHEMNYEDLMKLDVGSWFSEEYKGLHFSTLDEVLDVCKDKINVQIEIKPTKYDDALPEQVADIIRSHDMVDQCLVISLKDTPLKTIKEYAPEIKTGYCMMIADGDLTQMDFSDDVTIEEQNATESLVTLMHHQNKKVFVWTINSTDNLQTLVDIGVDGIITDNPVMISKALDEEIDYLGGFAKSLRYILD